LEKQLEWARQNSRIVALAGTAVLATVLGTFLFIRSNEIRSARAEASYGAAQQTLYTGNREEGVARLAETAVRYAGTNPGAVAALRVALVKLEERKLGEAINVLQEAQTKADKKIFGASLHGLLAAAWSDSGQYAVAAAEYEQAAQASQLENERAGYNLKAAEMYALSNGKERALVLLRELSAGSPSETRAKARKLLGELTVGSAKAG
jgi:predicted negative regulator of RcsB-dependent stress response